MKSEITLYPTVLHPSILPPNDNGLITNVTDPNNQKMYYTYDASNRVTAVQTTVSGAVYKNEYEYANDRMKTVKHNTTGANSDVQYNIDYDELGRKKTVSVGVSAAGQPNPVTLSTNNYVEGRFGLLKDVTYGNGKKVSYAYDSFGRVVGMAFDAAEAGTNPRYQYYYDMKNRIAAVKDNHLNRETRSEWDQLERPLESTQLDSTGQIAYRAHLAYDGRNRLTDFAENAGSAAYHTAYAYDDDNRTTQVQYDGLAARKVNYVYDLLNRVTSRTATNGAAYASAFSYKPGNTAYGENATSPLVSAIAQGSGANAMNLAYEYDILGNIVKETRNGAETTYAYDALGQLIRVNDPADPTAKSYSAALPVGSTWLYQYDRGGNLLSKSAHAYTAPNAAPGAAVHTFSYVYNTVWKDKLSSYDGTALSYDEIGNLTGDAQWNYIWEGGRQLQRMEHKTNGTHLLFSYDHDGLRTRKEKRVNGVVTETTDYRLHGKLITHMTQGTNTLHFYYDAMSRPAMVNHNGTVYTYVHNLQGDIVGILDASGALVVEYKYDAWGKPTATTGTLASTLGTLNPFRYRGYVWDEESKLYYLKSRYNNCATCRFINADKLIEKNIFTYSDNNPIRNIDTNGKESSENIPDYTDMNDKAITDFLPAVYEHNVSGKVGKDASIMDYMHHPDDFKWLINIVNHKAMWDLKYPDSWNKMFPNANAEKFVYRNMVIDREALGNITYGCFAKAMGLEDTVIFIGAGLAQAGNVNEMAVFEIYDLFRSFNEENFYGDTKKDHRFVIMGIEFYNAYVE